MSDYPKFGKIPRLHKDAVITEKIDGTNGLISIRPLGPDETVSLPGENLVFVAGPEGTEPLVIRAGSRNRWLTADKGNDNHGFAAWVAEHATELAGLGVGNHYGEWFGKGIQRGYGLEEKRFALFNVARWYDGFSPIETAKPCPPVCTVVPVLWMGTADLLNAAVFASLGALRTLGSVAVPRFDSPEGVVVYHMAAGNYFKVLLEGDDIPKSLARVAA